MKEATGEVSGTVVTIIIIALLLGIATVIFKEGGTAQKWIEDMFNGQIKETVDKGNSVD